MGEVSIVIERPAAAVFAALSDPHSYPEWLVGCREMRAVDPDWPRPGAEFHHRVGMGPFTVDDSSCLLEIEPERCLRLQVRARPVGRGEVTFRLAPDHEGRSTIVTLSEVPVGLLAVARPLLGPLTDARNRHSLQRLRDHLTASG